ncbi:MAG: hypothetical protein LBP32_05670, partial [Spirochaetaceae bacterium]|nr:hypothetical protein [Spirochaetaceae bacterium]
VSAMFLIVYTSAGRFGADEQAASAARTSAAKLYAHSGLLKTPGFEKAALDLHRLFPTPHSSLKRYAPGAHAV